MLKLQYFWHSYPTHYRRFFLGRVGGLSPKDPLYTPLLSLYISFHDSPLKMVSPIINYVLTKFFFSFLLQFWKLFFLSPFVKLLQWSVYPFISTYFTMAFSFLHVFDGKIQLSFHHYALGLLHGYFASYLPWNNVSIVLLKNL